MAGEEEQEDGDFSFPTTISSPPRFIGSPRLWCSSSYSLYVNQTKLTKQEHDQEECILTKEYRKAINLLSYIKHKDCDGSHENMDVIWEDLNYEEEIDGVKRRTRNGSGEFGYEMPRKEKRYNRGEVAVAGGGGKRPSMVVLINVLKKFLFMSHVTRNVKK